MLMCRYVNMLYRRLVSGLGGLGGMIGMVGRKEGLIGG